MPLEKSPHKKVLEILASLTTPFQIQQYLDSLPYIAEERNRSPLNVIQDAQCHCYDGALLAAAALRRLHFAPLVVDIWPDPGMDDDHVLALYRVDRCWGAVAKSNYAGLRFREPIHRTIRELVLTYFENFYSLDGVKTLRTYTRPLNLCQYDALDWEVNEDAVAVIENKLHSMRKYALLSPAMIRNLSPVDERSYQAGMHGTNVSQSFGARQNP